jgi:hypothetical protein
MKTRSRILAVLLTVVLVAALFVPVATNVLASVSPSTISSGVNTQVVATAFTLPPSITGSYNWVSASVISPKHPNWTAINGADWVSTTGYNNGNYGVENATERDAWRLFKEEFTVPQGMTAVSGTLQIAGDNAYEVYLNGHLLASTAGFSPAAPVYGPWNGATGSMIPFENTYNVPFSFAANEGVNTFIFVLRNWDNNGSPNPSGLIYRVDMQYRQNPNPLPEMSAGLLLGLGLVGISAFIIIRRKKSSITG